MQAAKPVAAARPARPIIPIDRKRLICVIVACSCASSTSCALKGSASCTPFVPLEKRGHEREFTNFRFSSAERRCRPPASWTTWSTRPRPEGRVRVVADCRSGGCRPRQSRVSARHRRAGSADRRHGVRLDRGRHRLLHRARWTGHLLHGRGDRHHHLGERWPDGSGIGKPDHSDGPHRRRRLHVRGHGHERRRDRPSFGCLEPRYSNPQRVEPLRPGVWPAVVGTDPDRGHSQGLAALLGNRL